jgi:two-component system, chemotaxis family, chemotaxis protein CheY
MSESAEISALIVEDNAHMRAIIFTLLHALGVPDIRQAADGAEAHALLSQWRPDLIIVDQNMKPVNGIEFARSLRRLQGGSFDTPIIMLTAHTERTVVEAARDAGVDEILAKPISAKALLARINAVTYERRGFVRSEQFVGPDRRRRTPRNYIGPKRRLEDDDDTYSLE